MGRETAEWEGTEGGWEGGGVGMRVSLEREDGSEARGRIGGGEEADAAQGWISHVAPMALARFGKGVGDAANVNGVEWEITALGE